MLRNYLRQFRNRIENGEWHTRRNKFVFKIGRINSSASIGFVSNTFYMASRLTRNGNGMHAVPPKYSIAVHRLTKVEDVFLFFFLFIDFDIVITFTMDHDARIRNTRSNWKLVENRFTVFFNVRKLNATHETQCSMCALFSLYIQITRKLSRNHFSIHAGAKQLQKKIKIAISRSHIWTAISLRNLWLF